MIGLTVIIVALIFLASASRSFAGHELWFVGELRDADPSAETIVSASGTCVPSHDRERLDCYFTVFALWGGKTEEQVKKEVEKAAQELNKDPAKLMKEMKKILCDDKNMMQPDPVQLTYKASYKAMFASLKAFCEHPTRESALRLHRTITEAFAKKCVCLVGDFRKTFVRRRDRWVAHEGPGRLCGEIGVSTLIPHDLNEMKEPGGPVRWTLHEKMVTTHKADDPLCANNPWLGIRDGAITLSSDAPKKSINCEEIDFISKLEGMADPRNKWRNKWLGP